MALAKTKVEALALKLIEQILEVKGLILDDQQIEMLVRDVAMMAEDQIDAQVDGEE